jgi:hypothetical protein
MQPWQVPLFWQTPRALQVCALPQATQLCPEVPQLMLPAPGWQVLLLSQQPEQLPGAQPPPSPPPEHTPATQLCPNPQAEQAVALIPQARIECPAWQAPVESQQPLQLEAMHAALSCGQPGSAAMARSKAGSRRTRYAQ